MFTILDYSSALEYSIIRRYTNIVYYYMFTRLDYSSALEYSIIRRYTNNVYYYMVLWCGPRIASLPFTQVCRLLLLLVRLITQISQIAE